MKSYLFKRYTTAEGLPSPEILSLVVDKKGFLWLGSAAGISRYDGSTFTNFGYTADNQFIGTVHSIKQGRDGRIWIGSSKGLYYYERNSVHKINNNAQQPEGIYDLLADEDGSVWLATDIGPLHIPEKRLTNSSPTIDLREFVLPSWETKKRTDPASTCTMIRKAADGKIYFTQLYQLFGYDSSGIQLLYTTTTHNDKMEALIPLNKSTVFFNSSVTGLHKVDAGKNIDLPFKSIYQPNRKSLSDEYWYTGSLGLVCFHPKEEFISQSINFEQSGAKWLTVVLKDQQVLWLASHSGLTKIKPSFFQSYQSSKYNNLKESFSMIEWVPGKKLFGANHGELYQFENDKVDVYINKNRLVQHAEIKALAKDRFDRLWIATGYEGLGVIDKGNSNWFREDNSLIHDNSFSTFVNGSRGELYAIGDKGLTVIYPYKKNRIYFKKYLVKPITTQYAKFYDGLPAPDGSFWIGGEEGFRYTFADSLLPYKINEQDLHIRAMKMSKDSIVWIATLGKGILACKFNSSNKLEIIKQYTERDGLNTDQFLCLLIDRNNNVWAGSIKGVSLIEKSTYNKNRIINFTESDGFTKPEYYSMYLHEDGAGAIWAGSSLGLVSFDPSQLLFPTGVPSVYINSISLVGSNEELAYDTLQFSTQPVEFNYKSNSLHFNYTAIDPMNQEGLRYFYRLEGLDSNWVDAGMERSVSYYYLEPGTYSFSVRAINAKGIESTERATFQFAILPPFWKTWWFVLITLVLGLISIFLFLRQRLLKINAKANIQLQLTSLEVKALRAQMNPHFIFNAMSSIQEFTIKNDIDNAQLYISKFSTLLRKVLHSSQQNFLTLEEELEMITLYLDIEKKRMGDDFRYFISVDESIETDAIKIPGMLLQPFVENALIHGLALKEHQKLLEINIGLKDDNWLLIAISDNGIGRKKAAVLKEGRERLLPQASLGLKLVKERINLLYPDQNIDSMIQFYDLTGEEGDSLGTTVNLCIPLTDPGPKM